MRYLCTSCNYIFDESIGDKGEGIKPGIKLDNLGDYFVCPVCGDNRDSFQEIIEEINYITGEDTYDFMEIEHFIDIYREDDLIEVRVGKELHPSGEEHRITQISLYDEYGDIVEDKFLQAGEEPEIEFDISNLDDFEVRVRCSLHGVWARKFENS